MESGITKRKKVRYGQIALNSVFILVSLCYILPFIMVISISLTKSDNILSDGFTLFPKNIDTLAYKLIFSNAGTLIQAYKVTILFTAIHTVFVVILTALIAYPISKSYFFARKSLTWFIFFTMLFNGGMIPSYLVNVQILRLGNSFWAYVLPNMIIAWNVIIVRTFYQGLPDEMFEAAKLDGASELRVFINIVAPLCKPAYATIGFLTLVSKWNDWYTTLIYIRDPNLYSLQYLLQTMLRAAENLKRMAETSPNAAMLLNNTVPTEQMRFSMALIAAGPVLLTFPFFQKYFTKGMTVGAVKG